MGFARCWRGSDVEWVVGIVLTTSEALLLACSLCGERNRGSMFCFPYGKNVHYRFCRSRGSAVSVHGRPGFRARGC